MIPAGSRGFAAFDSRLPDDDSRSGEFRRLIALALSGHANTVDPRAGMTAGMTAPFSGYGGAASAGGRVNRMRRARPQQVAQRRRGGCPPGPMTCIADSFASPDGGYHIEEHRDWLGRRYERRTKWGRYNCENKHGKCSFVGPGRGLNLWGVTEITSPGFDNVAPWEAGEMVTRQYAHEFEVDPDNFADRKKYGPDFFRAMEENWQRCPKSVCNE